MAFINYIPTEKRLQIGAETVVRALPFETNWTKIRIGVRCSLADTLGSIEGVSFIVGVMQGTFGWPDPNLPVAIASLVACSNLDTGNTWARGRDGNGNQGYSGTSGQRSLLKQFNTVRIGSSNASTSGYTPMTHTGLLGGYVVDIENLLNGTFGTAAWVTSNGGLTRSSFLTAVETATPAGFSTLANTTIAYTGNHVFNSAFVFWNHSTPSMDIADFTICRYY